jgi:hypothetical protein
MLENSSLSGIQCEVSVTLVAISHMNNNRQKSVSRKQTSVYCCSCGRLPHSGKVRSGRVKTTCHKVDIGLFMVGSSAPYCFTI